MKGLHHVSRNFNIYKEHSDHPVIGRLTALSCYFPSVFRTNYISPASEILTVASQFIKSLRDRRRSFCCRVQNVHNRVSSLHIQ